MTVRQPMHIQQPTHGQQQLDPQSNLQRQTRRAITQEGPATITRVVADLMIFVEFELPESNELVGLVFKPDKIEGYGGESLASLNLTVGSFIPSIVWDRATFLVKHVEIEYFRGSTPPMAVTA